METIVETCLGPKSINDEPYWHLVGASYIFYHNVRVGKGALPSVSAGIEAEPHLQNAHTPYSLNNINNGKENLFEKIRQTSYPHLPSRLKTLYVFDDYSFAVRAQSEWFPNEKKTILECRIFTCSVTHKVDSTWLITPSNQWPDAAQKYWKGEMSDTPFPEILVHGVLYFPNWEEFPNA